MNNITTAIIIGFSPSHSAVHVAPDGLSTEEGLRERGQRGKRGQRRRGAWRWGPNGGFQW